MKILFLGAGYSSDRRIAPERLPEWRYTTQGWPAPSGAAIHTLDRNPDTAPLIVADLERFDRNDRWRVQLTQRAQGAIETVRICGGDGWTLPDDAYDEVHAYEILEHIGAQGDVATFYRQMNELWRILKPGGHLCGTVPSARSIWAYGDPGHTRILTPSVWVFVDRGLYFPRTPPSSDYRSLCRCDFHIVDVHDDAQTHSFCLEAVKPARPFHD